MFGAQVAGIEVRPITPEKNTIGTFHFSDIKDATLKIRPFDKTADSVS